MISRQEVLLLDIIHNSGNIKKLLREKITYKEISELTTKLASDNYLTYIEKKIILTKSGRKALENGMGSLKETNKDLWIKPEIESRVSKIDKKFIFLPNQSELDF